MVFLERSEEAILSEIDGYSCFAVLCMGFDFFVIFLCERVFLGGITL